MSKSKSNYQSLVKSTAVFGGAQLIQMLVTILRAKCIALFFGSAGMGINAMLQSSITSISNFSSFGIFQSAVRDISKAYENGDEKKLSRVKTIFERLVWFTGILGTLICIASAPFLSKFAFGSTEYTGSFILLSLSILLMALANGKTVILQATRNLSYLAKSSVFGAFFSLALGIPLYYYLKINGIALALVIGYLISYLVRVYYTRKITFCQIDKIELKEVRIEGSQMIKLGSVLMFGTFLITLFTYLTNIFIGRWGSIEHVGLFQGASSLTTQSIFVVISVLASDFFPRLSAVCTDAKKANEIINQQLELVILIIGPIVIFIISFTPAIVSLLLSKEFLIIVPLLRWMALSLLFRGIWFVMSYVILAQGDLKSYLTYDALIGNGLNFVLNIVAYAFWGLNGLGVSFLLGSIVVSTMLCLIVFKKYTFKLSYSFYRLFLVTLLLGIFSFLITHSLHGFFLYLCSLFIIILSIYTSIMMLNHRTDFYQLIAKRIFKQKV